MGFQEALYLSFILLAVQCTGTVDNDAPSASGIRGIGIENFLLYLHNLIQALRVSPDSGSPAYA